MMAAKKTTQTTKKAEDVKINAPVKTAETVKTVKTETAAPAVKAGVKETVKEAPKAEVKTEAVKAEAPKAEKKEAVQNVYVQFAGKEILTADLAAQVTEKWVALGHRASSIKELNLYVKPEDNAAYYVINGKESGKIEL